MSNYEVFEISKEGFDRFKETATRLFKNDYKRYNTELSKLFMSLKSTSGEENIVNGLSKGAQQLGSILNESTKWIVLSTLASYLDAGYIRDPEQVKYVQKLLSGDEDFVDMSDEQYLRIISSVEELYHTMFTDDNEGEENLDILGLGHWLSSEVKEELAFLPRMIGK